MPAGVSLGMRLRDIPLLLPGAAVLAGVAGAEVLFDLDPRLCLTLLALGIAWGGRRGAGVGGLALGLLAGALQTPNALPPGIRPGQPIAVEGRLVLDWRRSETGWTGLLAGRHLSWRGHSQPWAHRLWISLPPGERPPGISGSGLRVRGLVDRRQAHANASPSPAGPWKLRAKSLRLVELTEAAPWWRTGIATLRHGIDRRLRLAAAEPSEGAALARALILGDRGDLPARWAPALRRLGLGHLLAVSGLHVGLISGLAYALGFWLPRPLRLGAAGFGAVTYLLLVGAQPSLARAAAMTGIGLLAMASRRPSLGANGLAVVAAGMAVLEPSMVRDLGFQLSVAATAGLIFLPPFWIQAGRWRLSLGSRSLLASVGAQAATWPFALPRFHLWVPLAALWNLVGVPWLTVILASSWLWVALAWIDLDLGRSLLPALDTLIWPLVKWVEISEAGWKWGGWLAVPVHVAPWLALGLSAVLVWGARRPARLGVLLCLGMLLTSWPRRDDGEVEMVMLDVGQGDAFLLRNGGKALLVDAGGWAGGDLASAVLLPALLASGIRSLEGALISHPDQDHCRGLLDLLPLIPIERIWVGPGWRADEGCGPLLEDRAGRRLVRLGAEESWQVAGWRLTLVAPATSLPQAGHSANDRSSVVLAEARGRRILFTGDLEAAGEEALLHRWRRRVGGRDGIDFLKVAHHGSSGSSGRPLLATLRPAHAFVSAGRRSRFGHPSSAALGRLEHYGIRVWTTPDHGATRLRLLPDGRYRIDWPAPSWVDR